MSLTAAMDAQAKKLIGPPDDNSTDMVKVNQAAWLAEQEQEHPDPTVTFQYAFSLLQSGIYNSASKKENIHRAIGLFNELIDEGFEPSICIFNNAIGYCALHRITDSRVTVERVLRRDPGNVQALELHNLLKNLTSKQGSVGLGLAAGLAGKIQYFNVETQYLVSIVVAGLGLKYLFQRKNSSNQKT